MNDIQTALDSVLRRKPLPSSNSTQPPAAQAEPTDDDMKAAVQAALKEVLGSNPQKNAGQ